MKRPIRTFITMVLTTVAFWGLAEPLTAQQTMEAQRSTARGEMYSQAAYSKAAAEISKSNPAVSRKTLEKDTFQVREAEPSVKKLFKKGALSDEDVQLISISAWKDYRQEQPKGEFSIDRYVNLVDEFGLLVITSTPNGAAIKVDGRPWEDPTNARNGARAGVRTVRLSKPGFEDAVGDVDVKKGESTLFHADLKPK